jgi:hypothetical protein
MRSTCTRALAAVLMAAAVATAMALPGWFGTSPEVHRVLTAPASSSKRVIHVDVRVTNPRRGEKAQGSRLGLGARSSSLASNVALRQTGSFAGTAARRQDLSAGHATRTRPPHKPRPVPPTAPTPAPAPTPTAAPPPAPAPVVAAPATQSEPTRELASAAPAPTPAPSDTPSPKAQRRDGATNDGGGGSETDTPDCDRGSHGGKGDDHDGDGGRRGPSDDHGGRGRDK